MNRIHKVVDHIQVIAAVLTIKNHIKLDLQRKRFNQKKGRFQVMEQ